MIDLRSPNFAIDAASRQALNDAVRADVLGTTPPFRRGERKRLSEALAVEAALALLAPVRGLVSVENANDGRRNMPGYDLLVGNRLRLQVKGGTQVESIGWTQSPDPRAVDLDYDFLILVDIGVMLDGRVGRLQKYEIPVKEMVDLYIVPNAVVRRWIESPRYVNGKGVQLYLYKRPVESGTREKMGQCIDLDSYRNRLDLLSESILKLLAPLPTS